MQDIIGIAIFLGCAAVLFWIVWTNPLAILRGKWDRAIVSVLAVLALFCAGALACQL